VSPKVFVWRWKDKQILISCDENNA